MISFSLPEGQFETVTKPGSIVDDWFVRHFGDNAGGGVKFSVSSEFHNVEPVVSIDIEDDVKWLRMLRELTLPEIRSGKPQIEISYAAECPRLGPNAPIGVVGILTQDKDGYFHPTSFLEEKVCTTDNKTVAHGIVDIPQPGIGEKIFLTLEVRRPSKLKIFSFGFHQPETANEFYQSRVNRIAVDTGAANSVGNVQAPYRVANFRTSKQLVELNDNIDQKLKKSPLQWMRQMLSAALRNEDYETAVALVDHAEGLCGSQTEELAPFVDGICKTLVALGDDDRLEGLAFKILRALPAETRQAPRQKLLAALGQSTDDCFSVNDRIGREPQEATLQQVLDVTSNAPDDHLLLANYYRRQNKALQHKAINTYLSEFSVPFDIELGDDDSNVLKGLTIHPHSDSARQQSDLSEADLEAGFTPLVTVICAAFNCEETIDYALRSLLSQSYQNIEILVADDESTDGTLAKLQTYSSYENVRIFKSEKNQGPYNIRNALIKEARGDFITFHDSDDFALPNRIEMQISNMLENGTVLSLGRWIRIMPNGHFVTFPDGAFMRMCVNSIMFHRKVFDTFGPYRSVLFGADSEFYEKARGHLPAHQVSHVLVPGVLGLWSSSSLTKTPGIEASERGYRAPKRRLYAGLAGRQRVLGNQIVPDELVEDIITDADIYRKPEPVTEVK